MAEGRLLPRKRNPLLAPDRTPSHFELVNLRRLGQTHLTVKPGQVGTSNATKPEHLGVFDYAHLRAPLPDNLKTSEIFAPQPKQPHPEAYFLMRRSSDGYVSATGMFKASFPWAKHSEEQAERIHIKSLPTTSHDEVAGNVWIPETYALELAEDYGILPWIKALLDESPVASDDKKAISPPPKFVFTANGNTHWTPPGATPRGRGRPRAVSPSKLATPSHKIISPRKSRTTKASREANARSAREASATLQAALDSAASRGDTESVDEERLDGDIEATADEDEVNEKKQDEAEEKKQDVVKDEVNGNEEKVTVEVDSVVEVKGDVETTHTNVKVAMPAGSPDLPLPESTEEMIAKAKEMVEEARKLEGESSNGSLKRKADELDDDEDDAKDSELQPAKRARLLEVELKKQRVRTRALIGVAATLAIGAFFPYVF